jgi:hypothetical protein
MILLFKMLMSGEIDGSFDGLTASDFFNFTNKITFVLDSAYATGCWWVGHGVYVLLRDCWTNMADVIVGVSSQMAGLS